MQTKQFGQASLVHTVYKYAGKQYILGPIFINIARYVLKIELDLPYAILHNLSGRCIAINGFVLKLFWIHHKKGTECSLIFPEYLWGDTMTDS